MAEVADLEGVCDLRSDVTGKRMIAGRLFGRYGGRLGISAMNKSIAALLQWSRSLQHSQHVHEPLPTSKL
jgi:hypothetical protein